MSTCIRWFPKVRCSRLACCMCNMTHLHLEERFLDLIHLKRFIVGFLGQKYRLLCHVACRHYSPVCGQCSRVSRFDPYKMSCCLNDCDEFSRLTPARLGDFSNPKYYFSEQHVANSTSTIGENLS